MKVLRLDFANFSSISLLNSTSSYSILGLIYLGFYNGPQANPIIFPEDDLYS
jgi:hypothetical protein